MGKLFRQTWEAPQAKGMVVVVHGMGEHSGRYHRLGTFLREQGFHVWSGDLPGWGQSEGKKGHIDSFDEYVQAVDEWVEEAEHTELPLFLLGHSMGGLVVVRYLETLGQKRKCTGAILSSPCLKIKVEVPKWKAGIASWLNRLSPGIRLDSGVKTADVTRDESIQQETDSDPHMYRKVSVRLYHEMNHAIELAWRERDKIRVPLLVLQAGDDRLVDPQATEEFAQTLTLADSEYRCYPGLYHEIFNEPEREEVFRDLLQWLEKRIMTAEKAKM